MRLTSLASNTSDNVARSLLLNAVTQISEIIENTFESYELNQTFVERLCNEIKNVQIEMDDNEQKLTLGHEMIQQKCFSFLLR